MHLIWNKKKRKKVEESLSSYNMKEKNKFKLLPHRWGASNNSTNEWSRLAKTLSTNSLTYKVEKKKCICTQLPDIKIPRTRRRIAGEFWLCFQIKRKKKNRQPENRIIKNNVVLNATHIAKGNMFDHRYSNASIGFCKEFISVKDSGKWSVDNFWWHWWVSK